MWIQKLASRDPVGKTGIGSGIAIIAFLIVCATPLAGCATSSDSGVESGSPVSFSPTEASAAASAANLSKAADKYTSAATPGNGAYKIGPMDVLDISVFSVPDLTKTVQVGQDGLINFPLIGEQPAAGKTAHEVEREMTQKLATKYLRSPQVSIFVKEYNSQRVTVDGSVKHPGVYTLKGQTTLAQVLAMAEGVDTNVASGEVVVFRRIDGRRSAARFDVTAINEGKTEDPELYPGDVIVVDTSASKVALQGFMKILPAAATAAAFVPLL
jgi:polysaccharide biosynthesis/export protein